MYVPSAFQVTDAVRLAKFMTEHSFATVVTQLEGLPFASHLPLLYDPAVGQQGTLFGHMARANPQWQGAVNQPEGSPALAIFNGPHTYISPTWYADPNTVPTWNYVAVHATGKLKLIDDPQSMLQLLTKTVNIYEAALPQPWRIEDQDAMFIEKLLAGIVGFQITVERLEGKWKLNQNQSVERRERVIETLSQSTRHDDQEIAKLMRGNQQVTTTS